MKAKQRRVGIAYPYVNLDSVPSITLAAEMLAASGYLVDVHAPASPGFIQPTFKDPHIHIIPPTPPRWERKGIQRFLPSRLITAWQVIQRHRRAPYQCFIGVDPQGLIQAAELNMLTRVPTLYYSLELLFASEVGQGFFKNVKHKEQTLSRRASLVIIQDEIRAKVLAEENSLALDKFILVPNSPPGPARRLKGDYWHRKFMLAPEKRVVLYSGSIDHWAALDAIAASVQDWPPDWVLVIHSRSESGDNEIIKSIERSVDRSRVFLSLSPVPRDVYDSLVDSAEIIVALYMSITGDVFAQRNLALLGLSSGKAAFAFRSGLPVIISRSIGLPEMVVAAGCGVTVDSAAQIGSAIRKIETSYETCSQAAMDFFDRHLDYAVNFNEVIKKIEVLK